MSNTTNMLLVTLLPTLVTFLVTSGVWVGVFFIVGLNNQGTTNNYYDSPNPSVPTVPPPNPPVPLEQCAATGEYSECTSQCEFVICESLPDDLYPDPDTNLPATSSTTDCWLRLINEAKEKITIGSYYWTLLQENADCDEGAAEFCEKYSKDGKKIFDALKAAAGRGIQIQIAMNALTDGYTDAEPLAIREVNASIVGVRQVDFPRFLGKGILHTKSWSVDGKNSYVGSANFDWRSFTQVKEIGMAVYNCPCIAEDVKRMLDIYWEMGAEDSKIPDSWPSQYTTNANHDHPYRVPRNSGPGTAVHFSSAPPPLDSCGRDSDIDNMVKLIDEAQDYLYMAVMDYCPSTIYDSPNTFYDKLDSAIRRAAFDRFVDVKFMISKWPHTKKKAYSYMFDFDSFSYYLPCKPGIKPCAPGKIEARVFELPQEGFEGVPYARVQHTKYFVSEKAAYIGTSNWSADYWISTGGIGISIRSADDGQKEKIVDDVKELFLRDWKSKYATPIWDFYINGTKIE